MSLQSAGRKNCLKETAAAADAGPLEPNVRELIKHGMAAAIRGEPAAHSLSHRALEAGASSS